jgi:hypothetical protein
MVILPKYLESAISQSDKLSFLFSVLTSKKFLRDSIRIPIIFMDHRNRDIII